jgi:hypothetical protein
MLDIVHSLRYIWQTRRFESYPFSFSGRWFPLIFFSTHAASRKGAGSSPDEVDFLNWPNPSDRTGSGVDSASNRNEYQESLKIKKPGGKVRLARRADNLAVIY